MRKKFTILCFLAISSTALANNIECNINLLQASAGGLMPIEMAVTLKQTLLQKSGFLELKQCSDNVISDLKIQLCAIEDSEALGVYKAELVIEDNNKQPSDEIDFTNAVSLLAVSKNGGSLVSLSSQSGLSPVFIKKMIAAKLDFPDFRGGDSLQIDAVVSSAYSKGVLKNSDIVAIDIESCTLK